MSIFKKLFVCTCLLFFPFLVFAHSGGTDSKGGHQCLTNCESYGLKIGEYHYHDANQNPVATWDNNSKIYNRTLAERVSGQILLQVENHGEAWYIDPVKCYRIYMKDGAVAYEIMRFLGLGITNTDLEQIPIGLIDQN